jgi:hypothetical protein
MLLTMGDVTSQVTACLPTSSVPLDRLAAAMAAVLAPIVLKVNRPWRPKVPGSVSRQSHVLLSQRRNRAKLALPAR